ncbi:hypothetical protein HHI36_024172 [Cryptolaemus montrouzieri]|uniref:Uncharacterized protein n=1 Tax=Cryptolaemus montrouzieri TaxID=559131 RepID=A0ABD2P392_9CUCU
MDELKTFISRKVHDVIILVETWLKEELTELFQIKNYRSVHSCRSTKSGGGSAIYVRKNLDFTVSLCETVEKVNNFVKITLKDSNASFCAIYRQNKSDIDTFFFVS